MKLESMQNIKLSEDNFDSTDFGDELLLITTTEKSLTAITVCKLTLTPRFFFSCTSFFLTAAGLVQSVERLTAEWRSLVGFLGPDQYSGS